MYVHVLVLSRCSGNLCILVCHRVGIPFAVHPYADHGLIFKMVLDLNCIKHELV